MRLAWYAGASTALAAAVITSAFYQRANFYSAMVYLSESNLCLMILVNIVFLIYGSFMYGLQRLCFGQLRPVEVEQLCDKAWFAVTETCLAMTVFREEVGGFFLVMFTALITGKVWGWIGEGRVEVLEQQPPANPRLFHTRLTVSLVTGIVYNFWLLHYAVQTVVQQARPNMMVMFLFEFAVLAVCSVHTALRYIMSLVEARVVKRQTQQRLEQRRCEVREQRAEIIRRREAGEVTEDDGEPLPNEDDVDEMDIEVPGWENKGQWVLFLDLVADFVKLCIYAAFFFVLLMFYGLPIHIMRDLFMTTRSFVKRLGALLRYRQALKDMNKYPDATEEELTREDTCIICREEMRPWDPTAGQVERTRPKKLPCGHILHFGCLKSWLERQQVCPTCRSSVVMVPQPANRFRPGMAFNLGPNLPNGQNQAAPANGAGPGVQDAQLNGQAGQGDQQQPPANRGIRMFNFGPIRLGFAQGGVQEMQEMAQRMGVGGDMPLAQPAQPNQAQQVNGQASSTDLSSMEAVRARITEVDHRIQQEARDLQHAVHSVQSAHHELSLLNLLLAELGRVRQINQLQQQAAGQSGQATPAPGTSASTPAAGIPPPGGVQYQAMAPGAMQLPMMPPPTPFQPGQFPLPPFPYANTPTLFHRMNPSNVTRHGGVSYNTAIPAGSSDLPEGVVIPPGWSLLPLQRMEGAAVGTVPQPGVAAHINAPDMAQPGTQPSTVSPPPPPSSTDASLDSNLPIASEVPSTNGANSHYEAFAPRSSAQDATRGPPTVAAPTPIMPNWGGSAQLFGGNNSNPFGLQPSNSSRSASGNSDTPAENSTPADNGHEATGGASEEQCETSASAANRTTEEQANGTLSNDTRGKAPAATVEDVVDDDA